jgi:hypothetical protein
MFNKEEEKLTEYKKVYDQVPISIDALDDAIMAGFQKAKKEGKRKPKKHKWIFSMTAAAILLIGLFASIRLSPAFAGYVSTIPGIEKIVELIGYDKGMISALENDYYQELSASSDKNGLTVTIDGAIADEEGLVLFYTLSSETKRQNLVIDKADLKSKEGETLDFATISYGSMHTSEQGENSYSGTLEFFFEKPYTTKSFELAIATKGDVSAQYSIPFTLHKEMEKKKTFNLNKTVTIEGQKMTFVSATIQPLRAAIHVKKDPQNTKKILNFDDLHLVDENGETWNKSTNGTTATKISDNEEIIYLQSNYFRQPKELYLVFNKIQAVDKENAYVVVDIDKEIILNQPKSNRISNVKVSEGSIDFEMPTEEEFPYLPFSKILDREGKEIISQSSYSRSFGDEKIKSFGMNISNLKKAKGPISFELSFYPEWIEGEGKIKID